MTTRVVNVATEEYDVLIDRTSEWGNPFVIGVDGTREEVIAKHMINLKRRPDLRRRLNELKGKRLGCHCKPLPCHGDNYIELIHAEDRLHSEGIPAGVANEDRPS